MFIAILDAQKHWCDLLDRVKIVLKRVKNENKTTATQMSKGAKKKERERKRDCARELNWKQKSSSMAIDMKFG